MGRSRYKVGEKESEQASRRQFIREMDSDAFVHHPDSCQDCEASDLILNEADCRAGRLLKCLSCMESVEKVRKERKSHSGEGRNLS